MPVITVEMREEEYEKKAEIAKVFTNELTRIIGVPAETISVLFHELSPQDIAAGGKMLAEKIDKNQK